MIQEEAAVATFLYDALLRGDCSGEVQVVASAHPEAAALAEAYAVRGSLEKDRCGTLVSKKLGGTVISRIGVLSCARRTALLFAFVTRLVVLAVAGALTFLLARAAVAGDGSTVEDRLANSVVLTGALEYFGNLAESSHALRRGLFIVESVWSTLDRVIYSSPLLGEMVPDEHVEFAVLALYFIVGLCAGLISVTIILILSLLVGFSAGVGVSCMCNVCLVIFGGLDCEVQGGFRPTPGVGQ